MNLNMIINGIGIIITIILMVGITLGGGNKTDKLIILGLIILFLIGIINILIQIGVI